MKRRSEDFRSERFKRMGEVILQNRDLITQRWLEQALLEQPDADADRRKEMSDDLPEHLRTLAENIDKVNSAARFEHLHTAKRHGRQRWNVGWSLAEVVRDFQILRMVVIDVLAEELEGSLTIDEMQALNLCLDESILVSVMAFAHASQEQLQASNDLLSTTNASLEERVAERTQTLHSMTTAVVEAGHKERQRIGRLLHDHLQQLLLVAQWRLEEVLPSLESTSKTAVESAHGVVREALEASRSLAAELTPPILADKGLMAAVDWLAKRHSLEGRFAVQVEMMLTDQPSDPALNEFLYFCAQELLVNAHKHSGGNGAIVRLEDVEVNGVPTLRLAVRDGGSNRFTLEESAEKNGLGIAQIVATTRFYDGDVAVTWTESAGNEVVILVPIRR